MFAALVAVPLLLPLAVRLSFVLFVLPLALLSIGAARAFTVRRHREPRQGWLLLGGAAAIAALASGLGASAALAPQLADGALYLGAGASVLLVASAASFLRRALRGRPQALSIEALLVAVVVVSLSLWFVVRPAVTAGEAFLTAVFVADLAALALMTVAAASLPARAERTSGFAIVAAFAAASIGDGAVACGGSPAIVAVMWAFAGVALLVAVAERRERYVPPGAPPDARLALLRMLLPFAGALSFPIAAGVTAASGELDASAITFFSISFGATLLLTFGRQAWLLHDNLRSVARERRLSAEVVRRNEELEALTALAATMTETLEENPVIERGLAALRVAARPTSMALHLRDGDALVLRATAGEWSVEGPWALRDPRPGVAECGGRQLVRLPVTARGSDIGLVTLVRPAGDPLGDEQLGLLRLLVDQVAIAVRNARDYRDRLEQAIRDPLTGVYNRRFFYEALEKELARTARQPTSASLVLIDVDNFKQVNDTLGHHAGDDVLSAIGRVAARLVRPADTFARVGGEEFALLLPDTSQPEALLVAERVRRAIAGESVLPDRTVTVSAGVASFPDDATTLGELHAKADAALYWAKRNGKNICAGSQFDPRVADALDGSELPVLAPHDSAAPAQ